MDNIALDVAAGIALASLPIFAMTNAMYLYRRRQNGGAVLYGSIAFVFYAVLIAGIFDGTIW